MSIDTKRTDYQLDLPFGDFEEPYAQFSEWYALAESSSCLEPNAMALATVDADGSPNVRMVLLKGLRQPSEVEVPGFIFYTNLQSQKAVALSSNPHAALCFFWEPLHRQVRLKGVVTRLSRGDVEEYFNRRPRGAQIAASISRQSHSLSSYDVLESEYLNFEDSTASERLVAPSSWGGFILTPNEIEFWQGASNRLHRRVRFRRDADTNWSREWLYP